MLRRGFIAALVAASIAAAAPVASADPTHAKNSAVITVVCGTDQVILSINGNGSFTPGHDVNGTSVYVPTVIDVTFAFTPTGGTTDTMTQSVAKNGSHANEVACDVPAELNTFTFPDGTLVISGTVSGFITPSKT